MSKEIEKKPTAGTIKNSKSLMNLNSSALSAALGDLVIPRLFYQSVIFIIDGSLSMENQSLNGIPKAEEIDNGIKSVIRRLKNSKNSNSFDISYLVFSDNFNCVHETISVEKVSDIQSFNPLEFVEPKGTNLNGALIHTKSLIEKYNLKYSDKSPQTLIIIMSDGSLHDYISAEKTISEIKAMNNTTIACQFLESHIDEHTTYYSWDETTNEVDYNEEVPIEEVKLGEELIAERFRPFATNDELFLRTVNPEEIRKHMIKSISMISKLDN